MCAAALTLAYMALIPWLQPGKYKNFAGNLYETEDI